MKEILVAVDFSRDARAALEQGIRLASAFGARLTLLHVVYDPADAPGFYTAKKAGKKVLRNLEESAAQMMEAFVAEHLPQGEGFRTRIVRGLPAAQILQVVEELKADLIVMGTHGRSGLKRLMLGSVADKVIRSATCPVLVVPQRKRRRGK
jgi:nucleotide-binding universal stress UspA family protein